MSAKVDRLRAKISEVKSLIDASNDPGYIRWQMQELSGLESELREALTEAERNG